MSDLLAVRELAASISVDAPPEQVADVWNRWQAFKRLVAATDEGIKASVLEWCETRGDLNVGDGQRLYAGTKKETKCISPRAALEALLEATGGDLDAVSAVLCSQPFKDAAAKLAVGERAGEFWRTDEVPDLKTGKAARELKQVNENFPRRKAG